MKLCIFVIAIAAITLTIAIADLKKMDYVPCKKYEQHFTPLFPDGEKLDSILSFEYNNKLNLKLEHD
jgi:hypothetical protein